MNLDGLFTVAALLAAVYAILPSAKRMSISFYLGRISGVIALLSFLIIICLHYYHIFYTPDISTPHFHVLGYILTPYDASFAVFFVAAAMILLIYLMRRKMLLPYRIVKFNEFILRLYDEEKYSEILLLVYDNLNWIKKVSEREFWMFKIHDYFAPEEHETWGRLYKYIKKDNDNTNISIKEHINSCLSKFFPDGEKQAEVADQIINMIYTDKNLIKVMAFNRNDMAISILGQQIGNGKEFVHIYLRYLIKDKNSILCSDLSKGRYNKVLNFLFADCNMAISLDAWRPIGEYVIEELNELYIRKDMSPDVYNNSAELYEEEKSERFMGESPLFIGVLFFDKMVHNALEQNIKHHMWLLYFRYFVERILRNLSPNKGVNMEDEFPTHYHRLLYEIVSKLSYWIDVVQYKVPLSQENIKLDSEYPSYMKGDIMEIAIATLGEVVYKITTCDKNKIKIKFKFYIIEMVYDRYFELIRNDRTKTYARALINSVRQCEIIRGCEVIRSSLSYKEILLDAASNNKLVDMAINGKFVTELRKILQDDIDNHDESNYIY